MVKHPQMRVFSLIDKKLLLSNKPNFRKNPQGGVSLTKEMFNFAEKFCLTFEIISYNITQHERK